MSKITYYDARENVTDILNIVLEYSDCDVPLKKTELVKGTFPTNYAYTLGLVNTLIGLGYVWEWESGITISTKGREFLSEIPF